jgi:ATP/maltotriose-dependent transcriptional regulator MalT
MERPEHSQMPFLNRRHTRRPRLTRLLDASSAQSIILTGPPGYGKTSLAAEWLGEHPSVAWYRATEGSADLAAFSTGLADVMIPLVPRAGHRLRQRLRVSEPPEDAVRPVAELLADDLSDWPDGSWLVIDDYHLVVGSAASSHLESYFPYRFRGLGAEELCAQSAPNRIANPHRAARFNRSD